MLEQTGVGRALAFAPDYAVAPGETLQEIIDALGMDQRDLARRCGLTPKTINLIIKGKAPITAETAIRLERVTGAPASFWGNMERIYRERLSRVAEKERLTEDLDWLREVPTAELLKRGAIKEQQDKEGLLAEVLRFFGVANVAAWRTIWENPKIAFRKSQTMKSVPGALAAWVRLGEIEAQAMDCRPYDKGKFLDEPP